MYLTRLMGFDYQIQYRSGNHNQVADTLSKLPEQELSLYMILFVPGLTILEKIHNQLKNHPEYIHQCHNVQEFPAKHPDFTVTHNLLLHKGHIWLLHGLPMISSLLTKYHTTPIRGHMGVAKMIARISENFYWSGLRGDVVAKCVECQHTKYETKKLAGLLCPLPVPYRPWEDLSLDFIIEPPSYHGNTIILMIVNRFSKGIHLGMFPSVHTTHMVASLFMEIVAKIHGISRSLVSDRVSGFALLQGFCYCMYCCFLLILRFCFKFDNEDIVRSPLLTTYI